MSNSGQFQKGVSGNPGGRPKKDNKLVELAKAKTPEAFKELLELLKNTSEDSVRLGCIKTVFEYGFGKPRQEVDVDLQSSTGLTVVCNVFEKKKPT